MSSVFNFAFYFNKTIVNLDSVCKASDKMNDLDTFVNETGNGVEDSAKFWMNIWEIPTIEEFKGFIDVSRLEVFNQTNSIVMNSVEQNTIDFDWDCKFLTTPKKEYGDLIGLFDEYELDGSASVRILEFLEEKHD